MNKEDVKLRAFAMPLTSPSFPRGEFKYFNREYLIITYETDIEALKEVVPEPLKVVDPLVKYEFIKMSDSTGFGDYTESGQIIPVEYEGQKGGYVHAMYLDDVAPIVAGREIWGFPKKMGFPTLKVDVDTVLGILKYNSVDVAIGTMAYKYKQVDCAALARAIMEEPNFLLKIIPNCNGKDLDVCQLVRYFLTNVQIKEAWSGPAALQLFQHVNAPVAQLPVKKVISGLHFRSDLTLAMGEVAYNYLV